MSNLQPIDRAIVRTLAYFDVFDYPLTEQEIWRWLYPEAPLSQPVTVADVTTALNHDPVAAMIERQGPFVVLRGRKDIVQQRALRTVQNEKKWRRALTVARYVEVVPFIKMVAVVNTVALSNARPESDIDLLVVAEAGHLWLTRLAVTGIVALLGYRRSRTNIQDKICLSFFISTAALDMEKLKRENDDPHFLFWTTQVVPLLDHGVYEKFQTANAWVPKLLPNAWQWNWRERLIRPNNLLDSIGGFYQLFFSSSVGATLEVWARQRQVKRMETDYNAASKSKENTSDVMITDDVLKFHEQDRRLEYRQKFYDRLRSLGL